MLNAMRVWENLELGVCSPQENQHPIMSDIFYDTLFQHITDGVLRGGE
jgi:hypothetical protein